MREVWAWLGDEANRQRIKLFFSAVVALSGLGYCFAQDREPAHPRQSVGDVESGGGDVTINQTIVLTPESHKQSLAEATDAIEARAAASEEEVAIRTAELARAEQRVADLGSDLKATRALLADAMQSLSRVSTTVPAERRGRAIAALARGDSMLAEEILAGIRDRGKGEAAEAAFTLGVLAENRLDFASANKAYDEAVELDPGQASYLARAGRMKLALGELAGAQDLLERALALVDGSPSADTDLLGIVLNDLAIVYQAQGRFEEAVDLNERSLGLTVRLFGPEHHEVATVLHNQGRGFAFIGSYGEAERLLKDALEIKQNSLGDEHPQTAVVKVALASVYRSQGRLEDARHLLHDAIGTFEKSPDAALHLSQALDELGEVYRGLGLYRKAEPLFLRSLKISEELLGRNSLEGSAALNNLGLLYLAEERYEEANEALERSMEIKKLRLDRHHPDYATTLASLGVLHGRIGRYDDAEQELKEAIETTKRSLGPNHFSALANENNLANLFAVQGRYREAIGLWEKVLPLAEKSLGPAHPFTEAVRKSLATAAGD